MRVVIVPLLVLVFAPSPASSAIQLVDDTETPVTLPAPAQRIVSLAPHMTELLFSAGAGTRIVATVEFSDYPRAARAIPRIGGSDGIDVERIVALKPDLIVGWASGNPRRTLDRLRRLGFPVYLTQPRQLDDIARNLEQLGRLAGTEGVARSAASSFSARAYALAARYAGRAPVRVFYQVLDPLLITVNGDRLISQILRLCGGVNIFATSPVLAPAVNEEAVLKADPQAIGTGGLEEEWRRWEAHWRERTALTAAKRNALYLIPADLLHRHTVRVLDGAERVCAALEDVRRKIDAFADDAKDVGKIRE